MASAFIFIRFLSLPRPRGYGDNHNTPLPVVKNRAVSILVLDIYRDSGIIEPMEALGVHIDQVPVLREPLAIIGFNGWGNALSVATDMADYLVRRFDAMPFARLDPDDYYRFDHDRPIVTIEDGRLIDVKPPGGEFYAAATPPGEPDLVVVKADEPTLNWYRFAEALFSILRKIDAQMVITLGSMYDNVLHSDRIVSGMSSGGETLELLRNTGVHPISYNGPTAIHSIVQLEASRNGMDCISLWAHCPYYLQGTSHYGILAELCRVLSDLGHLSLDNSDLEESWNALNLRIQELIEAKPELRNMITELRKEKFRGSVIGFKSSIPKDDKIIKLTDYLEPR